MWTICRYRIKARLDIPLLLFSKRLQLLCCRKLCDRFCSDMMLKPVDKFRYSNSILDMRIPFIFALYRILLCLHQLNSRRFIDYGYSLRYTASQSVIGLTTIQQYRYLLCLFMCLNDLRQPPEIRIDLIIRMKCNPINGKFSGDFIV